MRLHTSLKVPNEPVTESTNMKDTQEHTIKNQPKHVPEQRGKKNPMLSFEVFISYVISTLV